MCLRYQRSSLRREAQFRAGPCSNLGSDAEIREEADEVAEETVNSARSATRAVPSAKTPSSQQPPLDVGKRYPQPPGRADNQDQEADREWHQVEFDGEDGGETADAREADGQ